MSSFLGGIRQKKTHLYLLCQQTIGDADLQFKVEHSMKENEQRLAAKKVAKKIAKERPRARKEEI